jgi:AcrR family transcriptional regulator
MTERVELQPARRRRRREDSEQEILEVAERLLRERPFRELTVDDLMAATTQSRTAFYRHFNGRQDLLIRLLSDLNQELWEVSEGWFQGSGEDPLAEAREALERLASVYQAHGPVLLAMAEAAHHDDEVERVYGALVQGFADGVVARLERDAAAGRASVANPAEVAVALVWMTERQLAVTFGRRDTGPSERAAVVEALYTIWTRTLYGADPGR